MFFSIWTYFSTKYQYHHTLWFGGTLFTHPSKKQSLRILIHMFSLTYYKIHCILTNFKYSGLCFCRSSQYWFNTIAIPSKFSFYIAINIKFIVAKIKFIVIKIASNYFKLQCLCLERFNQILSKWFQELYLLDHALVFSLFELIMNLFFTDYDWKYETIYCNLVLCL